MCRLLGVKEYAELAHLAKVLKQAHAPRVSYAGHHIGLIPPPIIEACEILWRDMTDHQMHLWRLSENSRRAPEPVEVLGV